MSKYPEDDYERPSAYKWCALHLCGHPSGEPCPVCRDLSPPPLAPSPEQRGGDAYGPRNWSLPDANPKTRAGGANKVPLHLVPPTAIAHMAMGFADGGMKYQPYNWRAEPISASVYYGAAMRHLATWWEGEDVAGDSGVHHLAHAMCCLAMILDTMGRPGCLNDNRPPASDYAKLLDGLAAGLPVLRERESTKFDLHDVARDRTPFAEQVERELKGGV